MKKDTRGRCLPRRGENSRRSFRIFAIDSLGKRTMLKRAVVISLDVYDRFVRGK